MSFKSFLSGIAHDAAAVGKVFTFLSSSKGQATVALVEGTAETVTAAINPNAGNELHQIDGLISQGLREVVSVESVAAAAGAQSGTGAQKAAAVTQALAPNVAALLKSLGVAQPTADQVQKVAGAVATGVVGILNEIPPAQAAS